MAHIMTPGSTVEPSSTSPASVLGPGDWRQRLAVITEMMREMSLQDDPQSMVRTYGARMRTIMPSDRSLSLSRRGLESPWFRITRSSTWTEVINPWKQKDRLPLLEGGLLGDLLYGDEPRIIDDIAPLLRADDPAFEYLAGQRSLMAMPHYDEGVGSTWSSRCGPSRVPTTPNSFPSGSGSTAFSAAQRRIWFSARS